MAQDIYIDATDLSVYNNARNLTFELLNGTNANVYVTRSPTVTINHPWPEKLSADFPGRLQVTSEVPQEALDNPDAQFIRFLSNVKFAYRRVNREIIVNSEIMKFTNRKPVSELRVAELSELVKPYKNLIVAGSIEDQELETMAKFIAGVQGEYNVLIAPRYVESQSMQALAAALNSQNIKYGLKSSRDTFSQSNVLVLDTVGELREFYGIADIGIVGGGLVPGQGRGSHNPLESLVYTIPTIIGDYSPQQRLTCTLFKTSQLLKRAKAGDVDSLVDTVRESQRLIESDAFFAERQKLEELLRKSSDVTRLAVDDIVKLTQTPPKKRARQQMLKFS